MYETIKMPLSLEFIAMKYTQKTQHKLEKILHNVAYKIRYERGIFESNYCILQAKKVVVINKFLAQEEKINALIDIMGKLRSEIDTHSIPEDVQALYEECLYMEGAIQNC